MWDIQVQSLGQEDPLEMGMTSHSSILAWRIPRTEEPDGLPPIGSQRVRHDWTTNVFTFTCWQGEWLNTRAWCLGVEYSSDLINQFPHTHLAKGMGSQGRGVELDTQNFSGHKELTVFSWELRKWESHVELRRRADTMENRDMKDKHELWIALNSMLLWNTTYISLVSWILLGASQNQVGWIPGIWRWFNIRKSINRICLLGLP